MIPGKIDKRLVGDVKLCQQMALVSITNCRVCHGGRKRKLLLVQSKHQTWFYHCLSDYSKAPHKHLLSQSHCRGLHTFDWKYLPICFSQPVMHLCVRSHLHLQTSCLSKFSRAQTDAWFNRQLSPSSKTCEAFLSLLESTSTFHSTLCQIKFSVLHTVMTKRGSELKLLSPGHTRGILISAQSSCSLRSGG